jgi:hypothetical protein
VIITSGVGLLSQDGSNNVLRLASEVLITIATPVVFAVVAALIVSRQPRNTIGWLMTLVVGAFVVGEPLENILRRLQRPRCLPCWRFGSATGAGCCSFSHCC